MEPAERPQTLDPRTPSSRRVVPGLLVYTDHARIGSERRVFFVRRWHKREQESAAGMDQSSVDQTRGSTGCIGHVHAWRHGPGSQRHSVRAFSRARRKTVYCNVYPARNVLRLSHSCKLRGVDDRSRRCWSRRQGPSGCCPSRSRHQYSLRPKEKKNATDKPYPTVHYPARSWSCSSWSRGYRLAKMDARLSFV